MPQQGYGRNVKAQSDYGATQRAYQYSPKAAQEYLSGDQAAAYESARKEAYTPFQPGQGFRAHKPQIDQRQASFDRMERLRDVAGTNALGNFTKTAGELSKPWKLQASQGFLTETQENRDEPAMTAHPDRMGSLSDPNSYVSRRQALTARQDAPDEAFNLLKDNDKRLKLKAQFEAQRLGIGLGGWSVSRPPAYGTPSYAAYLQNMMNSQQQQDPEKAYAGY